MLNAQIQNVSPRNEQQSNQKNVFYVLCVNYENHLLNLDMSHAAL